LTDSGKSPEEKDVSTHFAPAGRDTEEDLLHRRQVVENAPLFRAAIDAMAQVVLILNQRRQVVAVNRCLACLLEHKKVDPIGKRPGELFECVHAEAGPDGCGTDWHCATCGAAEAILESGKVRGQVTRECRMTVKGPQGLTAMDLRATATLVQVNSERFTVCSIDDVSDEKRLYVLQRTFFHDVLNTAGSIRTYSHVLREGLSVGGDPQQDLKRLAELTDQLIEEIECQRDVWYAERNSLEVQPKPLATGDLLRSLRDQYAAHPAGSGRNLVLAQIWEGRIVTDRRLLGRVLGNLVKNALEATPPGGTVTLACLDRGTDVQFRVHNPGVMPVDVQLQVFKRSFTTKEEPGRGIGTHSARLFGERYLGGTLAFASQEPEGTTFWITLPKEWPGTANHEKAGDGPPMQGSQPL